MPKLTIYVCERCGSLFGAGDPKESRGLLTNEEIIVDSGCGVCRKGPVERVGEIEVTR